MALVQQNEPEEPQSNGRRAPLEDDKIKKRQRRPSVRLNEIGDQPAAALTKHWKPSFSNRPSKTRPLTNLPSQDTLASWKLKGAAPKLKREPKRPRTNWPSKDILDSGGGPAPINEAAFSKDFQFEGSQSPFKDRPPPPPPHDVVDDDDDDDDDERDLQFRARNDDGDERDLQFRGRNDDGGVDLDGPSDDSFRRFGKDDDDDDDNDDGVRVWLDGLGLGRYWLLFKIHEVDEEVLPFLTLEDLKDMGIHAVGSRRKIFCAIKKLSNHNNNNNNNEGFS